MPTQITLSKTLGKTVVAPVIRWSADCRLSKDDRLALDAYTREVEQTIRALSEAVKELQSALDKKTVG